MLCPNLGDLRALRIGPHPIERMSKDEREAGGKKWDQISRCGDPPAADEGYQRRELFGGQKGYVMVDSVCVHGFMHGEAIV